MFKHEWVREYTGGIRVGREGKGQQRYSVFPTTPILASATGARMMSCGSCYLTISYAQMLFPLELLFAHLSLSWKLILTPMVLIYGAAEL